MRSDIYLSGTFVRDLLLERDPALAEGHREELERARTRIDENVAAYRRIQLEEERAPFQQFVGELGRYFDSFDPALHWDFAERRELGYSFMKLSLLPKRMEIVHLTDQLSAVNQQQLESCSQAFKTFSLPLWFSLFVAVFFWLA